ncbi:MAG: ABC transporter permease, partial [Opitutales bacterium]
MRAYFLRRLLLIPPTLLGITLIVFAITRFVPGGPVEQAMMELQQVDASSGRAMGGSDQALSESQLQQIREQFGFDKPWYIAYVVWLGDLLRGDLGNSYRWNESVWSMIAGALPISVYYGIVTVIITYLVCIPLGILKAIKHRTWVDNLTSIVIFAGYAVPGYVLGALLILFFSVQRDWFPMGGFVGFEYEFLLPWGVFTDWGAFKS